MSRFRIMSNNIWHCDINRTAWAEKGLDCSSPCRAVGFLRVYSETKPDILGLQECSFIMADELTQGFRNAGLPYTFVWGRHTPVIYRTDKFELVDSEFAVYPTVLPDFDGEFNNSKTKSYCIAVLRVKEDGRLLIFATTHLWWKSSSPDSVNFQPYSDEARAYQLGILMDKIDEYTEKYNCPAIILGDFNANYRSLALQSALKRGYVHGHDVATEYSDETNGHHFCFAEGYDMYEDPKPFKEGIDHIILKNAPSGCVSNFDRYTPEYYMPLSDHFPVWIDVDF